MYGWLDSPAPAIGKSIGPGLGDWATIEELFWYRPVNFAVEKKREHRYCLLLTERWKEVKEGGRKMVWWL